MIKKIFLTILLGLTVILPLTPSTIHAADSEDILQIYCDRRKGDQINLETWYSGKCTDDIEESIGFADMVLLDILGKVNSEDPDAIQPAIDDLINGLGTLSQTDYSPSTKKILSGVLPSIGQGISFLYQNPPSSSLNYIASVKQNLEKNKLIKPALAASPGYGFSALEPLLPVWKAFRNIAYFFFILLFIAYGFMIMFRIKINPQTVISIQLALPKLILTLLLITFSYAIAGFIIDLFYLLTFLMFSVFTMAGIIGNSQLSQFFSKVVSGYSLGSFSPFLILTMISPLIVPKVIAGILAIPTLLGTAVAFFAPLSIIVALVLGIAVVITFFKIFWMLLKSYVSIILSIIFSPIILLGNVFPGSKAFSSWLKGIGAEFSIFFSTMVMFLLSFYFLISRTSLFKQFFGHLTNEGRLWAPPPLTGQNMIDIGSASLLGGKVDILSNTDGRFALLGIGMLLMTPKIAEMIKNALQMKDQGYGSAIGESLMWAPGKLWDSGTVKQMRSTLSAESSGKTLETIGTAMKATGNTWIGDKGTNIKAAGTGSKPSGRPQK